MHQTSPQCRCGHVEEAHEHYRKGSDCGICGRATCRSFRLDTSTVRQPVAVGARRTDRHLTAL